MRIDNGEILIVGDLHFSDVFTGKHKDYLANCCTILRQIREKLEEVKPNALVLLGDLIGWSETNIKNREVLAVFCKELKAWNEYCPVIAVKGNHDLRGYPDFLFLEDIGLIKTSTTLNGYFDYYYNDKFTTRFHIVDYNNEKKDLTIAEGVNNIVLGHNNYMINGVTTWYADHNGIELNLLQNFGDIDMVISGHIHNPSPEIFSTQMPSGKECMLLYPGCPTRPIKEQNMYEKCWFVRISNEDINTDEFELEQSSEIFFEDDIIITQDSAEEVERKENLKVILDELLTYRITAGSPLEQIDNIPNASQEAKDLAKRYLQDAYNASA